jgi:hypothetical protein
VTAPRPGQIGSASGHDPAVVEPGQPVRPSLPSIALWLGLALVGFALDGPVGAAIGVGVVAVILARAPRRLIGGAGVLALALVPIVIFLRGVPSTADVSVVFVTGSLWPHHLTFAGLALVGTYVVMDLHDHLVATARGPAAAPESPSVEPLGRLGLVGRIALVMAVVVASAAALIAVLAP